jgi:hypothetical protein
VLPSQIETSISTRVEKSTPLNSVASRGKLVFGIGVTMSAVLSACAP